VDVQDVYWPVQEAAISVVEFGLTVAECLEVLSDFECAMKAENKSDVSRDGRQKPLGRHVGRIDGLRQEWHERGGDDRPPEAVVVEVRVPGCFAFPEGQKNSSFIV
jgi:hypothetical protein